MKCREKQTITRRMLAGLGVGAVLAGLMPPSYSAAADGAKPVDLNLTDNGVAILGYDPVGYFEKGEPVAGNPSITAEHNGATYQFASAENRRKFLDDPMTYAPAFGGFCAYGVRTGRKFEIDPSSWQIVDGKLYLLLNFGTKAIWDIDRTNNIEIANKVWPKIKPYTDGELAKRSP